MMQYKLYKKNPLYQLQYAKDTFNGFIQSI